MKRKIFLYSIILVVIGLSVTGFFVSWLAQHYYTDEVKQSLKNTASMIDYQISKNIESSNNFNYNALALDYSKILNNNALPTKISSGKLVTRITIIDYSGHVLGDSETNYQGMENHLGRKEVQEAIKGSIGQDIRKSRTLGIEFLYIAVPIENHHIIVRVAVPNMQLNNIDKAIVAYTLVGILTALTLTILLALRFSSSLTYPINELILVSREISKGNYSKRVRINSRNELGELAQTFNEMASKLNDTLAEITDKNVKMDSIINSMASGIIAVDRNYRIVLINSIACEFFGIKHGPGVIGINMPELIRNNQINNYLRETIYKNISLTNQITLEYPHDKTLRVFTSPIKSNNSTQPNAGGIVSLQDITNIKKLEQIRTEFVSNVTHELKTPLTSIRGFIETLRGGAIDDKNVAEKFLEIIDIEAERLYILINDILQLSEIETKHRDSNIAIHSFKSIVDEVLPILEGVAVKKNVTLSAEIDENLMITANRDRIKQMLINIIENGIKYNVENGSVKINAYREKGKISIHIHDTGIGISENHLPRIFERFYRVNKGRSRSMGGTGLGLSIVKHIVNLYNGDIQVKSIFGKGTEFIIRLPA